MVMSITFVYPRELLFAHFSGFKIDALCEGTAVELTYISLVIAGAFADKVIRSLPEAGEQATQYPHVNWIYVCDVMESDKSNVESCCKCSQGPRKWVYTLMYI